MIFEYASLRGTMNGMHPEYITEIAHYIEHDTKYPIPPMTPFAGQNFNLTRAGIHADGLMKNPEIYNIFDTESILNRPPKVSITSTSGTAGIVFWLNHSYSRRGEKKYTKKDPLAAKLHEWVTEQFDNGRVTMISDAEMEEQIAVLCGPQESKSR